MNCIVPGVPKKWTRLHDFHFSAIYRKVNQPDIHTQPPLLFFFRFLPIQVTIEHQVKLLVLYSKPSLAIHSTQSNMYIVNPNLPISPTHPFPAWYPYICSLPSVSLSLLCKQVHLYHFSRFYIYVLMYVNYICFSSLCMTLSRYIHISANGTVLFLLWLSNIPLYTCTTSSLSISLLIDTQAVSMSWLL